MLKLYKAVKFSKDEYEHIRDVLVPQGKKGWGDQKNKTIDIKNHISKFTLRNQKCICPYCEEILDCTRQLEHIVNKAQYGQYTFERYNLVTSCGTCNHAKMEEDLLIGVAQQRYKKNQFAIVHPYFDDPNKEIVYNDSDHLELNANASSAIGKETIRILQLNSTSAVLKRYQITRRAVPTEQQLAQLYKELEEYKR